jgi:hypothetical protein
MGEDCGPAAGLEWPASRRGGDVDETRNGDDESGDGTAGRYTDGGGDGYASRPKVKAGVGNTVNILNALL